MFLSEWREFPPAPCLTEKKNWMTARVSMLLKSGASLTCVRACFIPGRAKDLSAPRYLNLYLQRVHLLKTAHLQRTLLKQQMTATHKISIRVTRGKNSICVIERGEGEEQMKMSKKGTQLNCNMPKKI